MFCKDCGNKIPDDINFCPKCGCKQGNNDESNGTIELELPKYNKEVISSDSKDLPEDNQQIIPNDTKQIAKDVVTKNDSKQISKEAISKKQPSNKRLIVTLFILLGFVGVLFIALIIVLASGGSNKAKNNKEIVNEIIEQEPKVDMQEISKDWDKGTYSINNIGASKANLSDYIGVWQSIGIKANAHDDEFIEQFDSSAGEVFIVIDESDTVHSITKLPDGVISSHETLQYSIDEEGLVSDAPKGATPDSIMTYEIIDGNLVITNYLDDMQLTECYIYNKTDSSVDGLLKSVHIQDTETITPVPTEAITPAPTVVVGQQVYEIESQILGVWEAAYENDYYGCEFYDNGTFRYIEQNGNKKPDDRIISYTITSENTMILNGDDTKIFTIKVDYEFGEYYLTIDNGETFIELSKVDELNPYPVYEDDAQDGNADGELLLNIEEFIDGTHWISTGVEYENENAVEAATGYPRTYDLEYGEIVYDIEDGIIAHSTLDSVYIGDPEGYFIYAFYREENIDGKTRKMCSMFFVIGDYLYEVETMDDVEVSNYIQYERYEP